MPKYVSLERLRTPCVACGETDRYQSTGDCRPCMRRAQVARRASLTGRTVPERREKTEPTEWNSWAELMALHETYSAALWRKPGPGVDRAGRAAAAETRAAEWRLMTRAESAVAEAQKHVAQCVVSTEGGRFAEGVRL